MRLGTKMNAGTRHRRGSVGWGALLCAVALVGCTGDDELVGATASSAMGATPLPEVERAIWENTPAGCEGQLDDLEWDFGVAAGAPELVVVVDPFGAPVCADTYSAVDAELRAIGSGAVDHLWQSYVTTLQELEVYSGLNHSTGATTTLDGSLIEGAHDPAMGEPNPQPSRGALDRLEQVQTDPNPQPSMPTGSAGSGNSSASGASSEVFRPDADEPTNAVAPTVRAGGL